jgi:intraflagellar transport protein 46
VCVCVDLHDGRCRCGVAGLRWAPFLFVGVQLEEKAVRASHLHPLSLPYTRRSCLQRSVRNMSSSEATDFSDEDFDDGVRNGKDSGDDDFEFGESYAESESSPQKKDRGDKSKGPTKSTKVQNLPFDEAVDLSDEDSLGTSIDSTAEQQYGASTSRGDSPPKGKKDPKESSSDEDDSSDRLEAGNDPMAGMKKNPDGSYAIPGLNAPDDGAKNKVAGKLSHISPKERPQAAAGGSRGGSRGGHASSGASSSSGDSEDDLSGEDDGEEEDDSPSKPKNIKGQYNPDDYAHLNVSAEVKDLWNYIGRYKPHNIELESKVKCFIPDFIPAVGEIDAFLKCPPPGSETEDLGLKVLDEPASNQSDPTVLDLQLRAVSKKSNLEPMIVRSLENADKNPREIDKWIQSISDLHRSKPPPQVHYTKSMPDIERLMQVWPDEFENALQKGMKLPPPQIDLSIRDYARVLCAILDIPVHQSAIESLHVMFTLYSEFAGNQHFMNMAAGPTLAEEVVDAGPTVDVISGGGAESMSFHK